MNGDIKIKLPHGVKVTCPTPESAIIILRSISFRVEHAAEAYPNERGRSFGSPPSSLEESPIGFAGSYNRHEGEGFTTASSMYNDRLDSFNDYDATDEEYESSQRGFEATGPWEPSSEEEFESSEDEEIAEEIEVQSDEVPDAERTPDFDSAPSEVIEASIEEEEEIVHKPLTRSRHSGSIGDIYVPVDYKMGERTKQVFEYIRNNILFTLDDVYRHAEDAMGMKLGKKTKRKLRDSLNTLKKAGLIEKTSKRSWRKVA